MSIKETLFTREAINRINKQGLVCKDTEESRKEIVQQIVDVLEMLDIKKFYYEIKFERIATGSDGKVLDRVIVVDLTSLW